MRHPSRVAQFVTIACSPSRNLLSFKPYLESLTRGGMAEFRAIAGHIQVVAKRSEWHLIVDEYARAAAATAAEQCAKNPALDQRFRQECRGLRFFGLRFDNIDAARAVLRAFARDAVSRAESAWIDTDHGWVIHAWDFFKRTQQDRHWDWRYAREAT
jgi:hypothetical protein